MVTGFRWWRQNRLKSLLCSCSAVLHMITGTFGKMSSHFAGGVCLQKLLVLSLTPLNLPFVCWCLDKCFLSWVTQHFQQIGPVCFGRYLGGRCHSGADFTTVAHFSLSMGFFGLVQTRGVSYFIASIFNIASFFLSFYIIE